MLRTVFSFHLHDKIVPERVSIGKFDGELPSIVAATVSEKVLIHKNVKTGSTVNFDHSKVHHLNFNQSVTAIATGKLDVTSPNDLLFVGTKTSLFAYDVDNNKDLFFKDVPDGVNCMSVGYLGSSVEPILVIGGNCTIQGFNKGGDDVYWTVTGDNILCLSIFDYDDDGKNELLVGSEDFDIRVFKGDAILYDMSETDAISSLCPIMPMTFGYALANGTVGIYHQQERMWRIKSKNRAISLVAVDVNNDGHPELITGWSSGKLDVRNIESGEVIFKDTFASSVAAILVADYNLDGIEEILVISTDGEVRGYQVASLAKVGLEYEEENDLHREEDIIRDLLKKRQAMITELKNYQVNKEVANSGLKMDWKRPTLEDDQFGAIPANTQIKSTLTICPDDRPPSIQLTLSTSNETVIRSAIIFAEGIFKGESFVVHPADSEVSATLKVALRPEKDSPVDLHIKAIVGQSGSLHFHVFELTRRLPKFAMYAIIPSTVSLPSGKVTLNIEGDDIVSNIQSWLVKNFLVEPEVFGKGNIDTKFLAVRDSTILAIKFDQDELTIFADNIDLAGQVVQSLVADHLEISDLECIAHFPQAISRLKELVTKVDDIQVVRSQLAADVADSSAIVKSLLIRAEDARLLGQYAMVRSLYLELSSVNFDLLNEYKIREKNQNDLKVTLKSINSLINEMANLRVGKFKNDLIQSCRQAIQQNNLSSLAKIVSGHPSSATKT